MKKVIEELIKLGKKDLREVYLELNINKMAKISLSEDEVKILTKKLKGFNITTESISVK